MRYYILPAFLLILIISNVLLSCSSNDVKQNKVSGAIPLSGYATQLDKYILAVPQPSNQIAEIRVYQPVK